MLQPITWCGTRWYAATGRRILREVTPDQTRRGASRFHLVFDEGIEVCTSGTDLYRPHPDPTMPARIQGILWTTGRWYAFAHESCIRTVC